MPKKISRSALIEEPLLAEILSAPITQALMQADGVTVEDVQVIVNNLRRSLGIATTYRRPSYDCMIAPQYPSGPASSATTTTR